MMEDQNVKKETENQESQIMETSEIEKLTDDCLVEIFQHLTTIADKIRIERVCKRWQYLSQRSWNNFQSIDFSAKTWGMEEKLSDQQLIRDIDFDKIIRLSGRYLTSIITDVKKFAKICYFLPNIRKLQLIDDCLKDNVRCKSVSTDTDTDTDLSEIIAQNEIHHCTYKAWQIILSWLMSHGPHITSFKMKLFHKHYQEKDFATLFRKMKQLKSFSLGIWKYQYWSCTFLLELPFEIIQEIVLTCNYIYEQPFDNYLLFQVIQKCKTLQTLSINLVSCEEPEILKLLPLHAASLKNLQLRLGHKWSREWESLLLSTFSALTNLEKLDVSHCYHLRDAVLEVVAKNCKKLTYLNLSFCDQVTDRGICSICTLENLLYLNIVGMKKIENSPLAKLASLIVLDFYSSSIQEECLCNFLREAYQLRALHIVPYFLVSNKILNVAIEVARTRKSNNALDLYIRKSEINMGDLDDKPPFLNIIDSFYVPLSKYGITDPFNFERLAVRVVSGIL